MRNNDIFLVLPCALRLESATTVQSLWTGSVKFAMGVLTILRKCVQDSHTLYNKEASGTTLYGTMLKRGECQHAI